MKGKSRKADCRSASGIRQTLQRPEALLGEWSEDGKSRCEEQCYKLNFDLRDSEGNIYFSIYFYDGGPFQENYTGKVVSENHAELYLESVKGTNSFKKVRENVSINKKEKIAD